ncbi:MAG: amidohydrolase [Phycisphaerales bacterium]|nr:amidohydrolase [Phycisphaerales bacterium]
MPNDRLRGLIKKELPALRELRRDLHRHPELSYQEQRTSGVVQRELAALGIDFKAGLAGTGVVAHLPATRKGGQTVALRADMDALPIQEATGAAYSSGTPGVMHACGHDGHTTMLLGAARVLSRLGKRPNPVTLIFQPAEEGGAGADRMCRQGALRGARRGGVGAPVRRIYGLHGWPPLPLGVVATRPGPLLAATDEIDIEIRGFGGHAAYPHLCRDPVVAAAHVITALQTLASRAVSPLDSVVCTIGIIEGGSANNIIPDSVRLTGTVRTLREGTRTHARERLMLICRQTAAAHGCRAVVKWSEGYPVTRNDPAEADRVLTVARDALGKDRVQVPEHATMGGEDFSYYGAHVPACFFFLGLRPPGPRHFPNLHTPEFDFNDDALPTGVEMLCRLALRP